VSLHCEQEKEPMGTAGPLALANEILNDGSGDPFFVLNRWAATLPLPTVSHWLFF
jgi:NDP-sugar pyrophosphorylase family protein